MASNAAAYLTTEPASTYYGSMGFEMALMYALDPVAYAAYGRRALHLLLESQNYIAPTVSITSATNSNPAVFTTGAAHGLSSRTYVAPIWGGTGNWQIFNNSGSYQITVLSPTTFSVAVDSTALGPLTGKMTVTRNSPGFSNLNQGRWETPMIAAIWDWTHDQIESVLTPEQINIVENVMTASIRSIADHPYAWANSTPNPVGGIGNLTIGPLNGALQMAVAFAGDVPAMDQVCNTLRNTFLTLAPVYTVGASTANYKMFPIGRGGALVESTEYAPQVSFYLLTFLETMKNATGEDLFPQLGTWPAAHLQFLFHAVSPGNAASGGKWGELFPYGDILYSNQHGQLNRTLNGIVRQVVEQLTYYFCSVGDSTNCGYGQYWLQNVFTEAQMNTQGWILVSPSINPPNEFLWYDPNLTAINPQPLYGLDYLADGYGVLLSRSGWGPSATWIGFKGGALRGRDEDHFHSDILTFGIYRKGDWLTNELIAYGAGATQFHNSPLPESSRSGPTEGSNPPSTPNSIYGMTDYGRVKSYSSSSTGGYVFVEADATPVYRGSNNSFTTPPYVANVNTVVRDFLYLKPDIVVILDRLAYDAPSTANWNLQALADPGAINGNTFTLGSLLGRNALNVSVAAPVSPVYKIVQPVDQIAESNSMPGNPCGCANQWRIEISSGNAVLSEQYMVVMQAGDSGFMPLPVAPVVGTNIRAAQFGKYLVAGLTDTQQIGTTRSYRYTAKDNLLHIVMGMKPLTRYSIDRSVSGIITMTDGAGGPNDIVADSGGLLVFTTGSSVCDANGDGKVDIVDVQMIISEALGTRPPLHDLNGDGKVDIIDVQIALNGSLGLGCSR